MFQRGIFYVIQKAKIEMQKRILRVYLCLTHSGRFFFAGARRENDLSNQGDEDYAAHNEKIEQNFNCQHQIALLSVIIPAHFA